MTRKELIDALTVYVKDYHTQRRRDKETESSFIIKLSHTCDLRELTDMWRSSFTYTPQRRQLIENKMKEVIAGVTPDNIPDGFEYLVHNSVFLAPTIKEAFNQKVEGLLEALEASEATTV